MGIWAEVSTLASDGMTAVEGMPGAGDTVADIANTAGHAAEGTEVIDSLVAERRIWPYPNKKSQAVAIASKPPQSELTDKPPTIYQVSKINEGDLRTLHKGYTAS